MSTPLESIPQLPVKLGSKPYVEDNPRYFRWMHEQAPVCRAKFGFVPGVLLAGYDDCVAALKDPRLVRDRRKAGAKSRMPFPLPRATRLAAFSMIDDDGVEHRRLRTLVHRAFTPRALAQLESRIESLTHELLDEMEARQRQRQRQVDLIPAYSLPIPVTVTREMLGVNADEMPHFIQAMRAFSREFGLWSMISLLFIDLPRTGHLVNGIIERKRSMPEDDILSALVEAEEAGDRLSKDELVSMTYLLIVGGYETTVHLITNAVLTLLRHPAQLAEVKASLGESDSELLDLGIEEVLRYAGPVQGTKILFASEELVIRDIAIPRGTAVFVCTAAANRDPAIFERPDVFDIHRARHKHLALGHGPHFCLGAALARMETKIALRNLLTRFPELRLAVPESELEVVPTPLWYRHRSLPVELAPGSQPG